MVSIAHICAAGNSLKYQLYNQLHDLVLSGYAISAVSAGGDDLSALKRLGIRHLSVPMKRSISPLRDIMTIIKLYRILRQERFRLIHTHFVKSCFLAQIAGRLAKVPVLVSTIHGFYFEGRTSYLQRQFYILIERISMLLSDLVLSQSAEDIKTAHDYGICQGSKLRNLGNGIDLDYFNPDRIDQQTVQQKKIELGLTREVPIVGFVGRLVEEKGILVLLNAARMIRSRKPEVMFLIAGWIDSEKKDCVDFRVMKKYNVDDAFVFAGKRHDMPFIYSMMDILVLPSFREGLPRAPMEASAMGVPCVVSDIRGCREVIKNRINGLLVKPGNASVLAGAVLEILSNHQLADDLGAAGRRLASMKFDERKVFRIIQNEYSRLLRMKGFHLDFNLRNRLKLQGQNKALPDDQSFDDHNKRKGI